MDTSNKQSVSFNIEEDMIEIGLCEKDNSIVHGTVLFVLMKMPNGAQYASTQQFPTYAVTINNGFVTQHMDNYAAALEQVTELLKSLEDQYAEIGFQYENWTKIDSICGSKAWHQEQEKINF